MTEDSFYTVGGGFMIQQSNIRMGDRDDKTQISQQLSLGWTLSHHFCAFTTVQLAMLIVVLVFTATVCLICSCP